MIPDVFSQTFQYLLSLDEYDILRLFWYFFLFDLPRYIFVDIFILLDEKWFNRHRLQNEKFEHTLVENPPLTSVIIPALNEEKTIGWTVRSLKEQTYKNIEIIIVDDGSTDKTPLICRRLAKTEGIRYLRFHERAGKAAALNYGIKFAKGEFIVFVDSDTTFDRDAIFKLMTSFSDPKVGGVSGNLRPRNSEVNLLTRLQQIEYLFTISIGRRISARFNILPIISGAFGGYRRELIELRGHEPGPGEDSEMTIRIRKLGYKIAFQPKAYCLTNVPTEISTLVKQRLRWNRSMIKSRIRKHKNVFNPYSKNFRFIDVITFLDPLFYHIVFSILTLAYISDLAINYPEFLPSLLFINLCLYLTAGTLKLIIGVILSNREEDIGLFIYLPLLNPFKVILKAVRAKAYIEEFFLRLSNLDPFAPYKVRQNYIQW